MSREFSFLALDLGAESGRAMLGQFDGERIQLSEVYRYRDSRTDGMLEEAFRCVPRAEIFEPKWRRCTSRYD